ncbi:MAG: response regulator [Proteobacteria bacterium]|nr:response regulator [Pseudomonadota bacterium]
MKALIVEDDLTSQQLLQELLKRYGTSHAVVNGMEAVAKVTAALKANAPYDLICLDIMMPEMNGQQALVEIRDIELQHGFAVGQGAKILMTTALGDKDNVMTAFREQCDGYLVKPIETAKLLSYLQKLNLLEVKDTDA